MKVVLDTNVFFDNWLLKGPTLVLLEKYIAAGQAKLIVPEIVVLETLNLYRRELEKHISSVQKIAHLAPSLTDQMAIPDSTELCSLYEADFRARLAELQVDIPGHADIPHNDIVSRALACRKPFRESDKGYRDTLLWEVILRKIANSEDKTFFITKNPDDFCASKDSRQLHAHLLDDLKVADLVDSVEIYLNFKSFIDSQITPHWQQATTRAPEELRQGVYQSFSIAEWFLENRDSFINSANNWVNPLLQSQSYLEDPEVKYIEDPDVITIENVVMVEEHKAYLDATALADVVIDVFIHKSEYYSSPEMPNLDIMDSDWNEYYVWGQLSLKLPIAFSVILNIINEQVEQFEINPLREIYGWCKHCGQPVLSDAAENCSNCRRSLLPGRIISINF